MSKKIPYSDKFKRLARNNYKEAYNNMERAMDQIRAYLIERPTKLSRTEANVIAEEGKRIGEAALALEQRIIALGYAGHWDKDQD